MVVNIDHIFSDFLAKKYFLFDALLFNSAESAQSQRQIIVLLPNIQNHQRGQMIAHNILNIFELYKYIFYIYIFAPEAIAS